MAKERVVIETTDKHKAALVNTVDLQGSTLSGWLEEQLEISIGDVPRKSFSPRLAKLDVSDLEDAEKLMAALSAQDWAFTDDDTRYSTHDLHPYPAKFIPQIPASLINALSVPGDIVFDPFGGSATTAVEAVRLGRRAVSLDANPLSAIIGRVKTGFLTPSIRGELEQLQATVASYLSGGDIGKTEWTLAVTKRHASLIPVIPNLENWFHPNAIAELALIRYLIGKITTGLAADSAMLALSRIVIRVSNQESETRYVAEEKLVPPGLVLRAYAESLKTVVRRLEHAAPDLQRADASFLVADGRAELAKKIGNCAVHLIVTSPPYPNATDYHLYHRFRLFWLGFDPRLLGAIEIGSHLRHQRNGSGFEEYRADMAAVLSQCFAVLQPGRYAAFVVGDAIFKGKSFSTASAIIEVAKECGFTFVGCIDRPIHETKRSFSQPARRARKEQVVVFRKPDQRVKVKLSPPAYRMWDYEVDLRRMEIEAVAGRKLTGSDFASEVTLSANSRQLSAFRRAAFSKELLVESANALPQPTWQKVLENGDAECAKRKDPKYATHGLHAYKGKFYPQLAKSLINISEIPVGARILDPYCGSGTSLLEGMLNGFAAFGCDMNPLAAKIARAKTGIFSVDRSITEAAIKSLLGRIRRPPPHFSHSREQFAPNVQGELDAWFADRVLDKLEWALGQVRLFGEARLVEFCEVVLSSLVREISQQDPTDLRIRRRKAPLTDAPVLELFSERLEVQLQRLQKYWSVAGRQPGPLIAPIVAEGDSRKFEVFNRLGLDAASVDCVITSPPYATALPYIDTDRLSLMAIMGIPGEVRSDLEERLIGSREIRTSARREFERLLESRDATKLLPEKIVVAIRDIQRANRSGNVGFRRENMGSLLWRYFSDMQASISMVARLLKPGARAFYVVGNSRTKAGSDWKVIDTCGHLCEIAKGAGLRAKTLLDISVTTENYKHIRNAITENAILEFQKPNT